MNSYLQYIVTLVGRILQHLCPNKSLVAMLAPLLHASHAQQYQHERQHQSKDAIDVRIMPILEPMPDKSMDDFLAEVRDSFGMPMQAKRLHAMSKELQGEYREKLKASSICMLPSFHHTLPTGREQGTILALDVGGSTFRVALVNLTGKTSSNGCESRSQNGLQEERPEDDNGGMEIKRIRAFAIDNNVRALCGSLFFDWMAQRIEEVLAESPAPSPTTTTNSLDFQPTPPLPMALAWSFPIEQTSTKRGLLLPMGKGFYATQGVEGSDIYTLVSEACAARSLNVQLTAIVNDSSATLLSQAYRDPSTRISLIMGTGINSAVYLPVNILEKEKFGAREEAWWQDARHVLVNTELSMFGKNVWPASRWDDHLNQAHNMPDFQPLEYKAGGRFLGEIVRLVLVEGVETAGLFHGEMPVGLNQPYALDTGVIAAFEGCVCCLPVALLVSLSLCFNHEPKLTPVQRRNPCLVHRPRRLQSCTPSSFRKSTYSRRSHLCKGNLNPRLHSCCRLYCYSCPLTLEPAT